MGGRAAQTAFRWHRIGQLTNREPHVETLATSPKSNELATGLGEAIAPPRTGLLPPA